MQISALNFTSSRHFAHHRIILICVFLVFELKNAHLLQAATTQNHCTTLRKTSPCTYRSRAHGPAFLFFFTQFLNVNYSSEFNSSTKLNQFTHLIHRTRFLNLTLFFDGNGFRAHKPATCSSCYQQNC